MKDILKPKLHLDFAEGDDRYRSNRVSELYEAEVGRFAAFKCEKCSDLTTMPGDEFEQLLNLSLAAGLQWGDWLFCQRCALEQVVLLTGVP